MNFKRNQMFKTLVYLLFFASISTSLLSAPNYGTIAQYVANLIQNNHYSRTDFEDEVSEKFLESYLKFLDSNKLYFNKLRKFNKLSGWRTGFKYIERISGYRGEQAVIAFFKILTNKIWVKLNG